MRPSPNNIALTVSVGIMLLGAVYFLAAAPWLPNRSVATKAAAVLAAGSPRPHVTPRPALTLDYFAAPCRVKATRQSHAYEWLCPNGDVYRAPLTN